MNNYATYLNSCLIKFNVMKSLLISAEFTFKLINSDCLLSKCIQFISVHSSRSSIRKQIHVLNINKIMLSILTFPFKLYFFCSDNLINLIKVISHVFERILYISNSSFLKMRTYSLDQF